MCPQLLNANFPNSYIPHYVSEVTELDPLLYLRKRERKSCVSWLLFAEFLSQTHHRQS